MSTLFIIGNGFDLAHGLKTSYNEFKKYLEEKSAGKEYDLNSEEEIEDEEERRAAFYLSTINLAVVNRSKGIEDWGELETLLGELTFEVFLPYDYSDNERMNIEKDAEVANVFQKYYLEFNNYFMNWVKEIHVEAEQISYDLKELVRADDIFINFNYTNTLEKYYGIKDVYHIHGTQNQKGNVIVGHGYSEAQVKNKLEDLESSYPEAIDYFISAIRKLSKDTNAIIVKNKSLFSKLELVDCVISYGISYSESDLPYIKEICKYINGPEIVWYLTEFDRIKGYDKLQKKIIQSCGFTGRFDYKSYVYIDTNIPSKDVEFVKNLAPFPFVSTASKYLYMKVDNIPTFEQQNNKKDSEVLFSGDVEISLINESMMSIDSSVFNESINEENEYNFDKLNYRPYLYSYTIKSEDISMDLYRYFSEIKETWMKCSFDTKDSDFHIEGSVVFSASPTIIKRRALSISKEEIEESLYQEIEKTYDTRKSIAAKGSMLYLEMLTSLNSVDRANSYRAEVYNVGQGNCIYLKGGSNKRILFDIGYGIWPNSKKWNQIEIKKVRYALFRLRPNMVVLSHWDRDHILGVAYCDKSVYDIPWIGPDLNNVPNVSLGAKRLAKHLQCLGKLFLIGKEFYDSEVYGGNCLVIHCGQGKNNTQNGGLNKANNCGLIIELRNKIGVLSAGDCEYSMLPKGIDLSKGNYQVIVAPHHGSKMPFNIPIKSKNNNSFAIVSVGENHYTPKHPYNIHMQYLMDAGYEVYKTEGTFKTIIWDDEINPIEVKK